MRRHFLLSGTNGTEVTYTTYNQQKLEYTVEPFDVPIIENTYNVEDNYGTLKLLGTPSRINAGAFENSLISDITLPSSIITIEYDSFSNCDYLSTIFIPDSVKELDSGVFDGCNGLTSVKLSNNLKEINGVLFRDCSLLSTINIPSSVEYIRDNVFLNCTSLIDINIPKSVRYIGYDVFSNTGISNLEASWEDNVLYVGNWLIDVNFTKLGSLIIKEGTIGLAKGAMLGNSSYILDITFPNSIMYLNWQDFTRTKWYQNLPTGGHYAGKTFFRYKQKPDETSIVIKEGTTTIQGYAFSNSHLHYISIPDSVTYIADGAFYNCFYLKSITIPENVTCIEEGAFYGCVLLKDKFINNSACTSDNNWGATLADKEQDGLLIKDNVVVGCDKTILTVVIPDNILIIDSYAFESCELLTTITIPNSITQILHSAFYLCYTLKQIIYLGTKQDWSMIAIDRAFDDDASITIICTDGEIQL